MFVHNDLAERTGHATQWQNGAMSPRFLTLADVAETLNLSMSAARALVSSGELPAIQVGGKRVWRVEDSALEAYIQQQYEATRRRIAADAPAEDSRA